MGMLSLAEIYIDGAGGARVVVDSAHRGRGGWCMCCCSRCGLPALHSGAGKAYAIRSLLHCRYVAGVVRDMFSEV